MESCRMNFPPSQSRRHCGFDASGSHSHQATVSYSRFFSDRNHNTMQLPPNNSSIPVNEVYWSLVHKADKKFSKIRHLPFYYRNRLEYDAYFYKVFKVYTQVWKFQQENRQKLVESGLKRWEIGEIASRIAQLYFGQYMRTSEASYLSEAYIFYDAIFTREYFKDGGMFPDLGLATKQLRFISRFITVCLLLNRRDMVHHLLNHLKLFLDDCKRTFQDATTDFREWKLVVQELLRFLKADTTFMNLRPLRFSVVLDQSQSDSQIFANAKRNLRLRDAVLTSYHHNEVKFSELTLDTFRMLQCLEWEPSGSFYQSNVSKTAQNGTPSPTRTNYSQEISDPTLPPNPRKAVLYRPSLTHFLAVVATICEELPHDGVLLIYLSASGAGMCSGTTSISPLGFPCDRPDHSSGESKGESSNIHPGLLFGTHGNRGINCIYPSDLVPFTRRPLFLVIDSDSSEAFEAFCLLLGISGSDVEMDKYTKAEKLLSLSLNDWGLTLVTSETLDPVWAQIFGDPFLRRILLRFVFCLTVFTLYAPTFNKKEFVPKCLPGLPVSVLPTNAKCQNLVRQIADIFGASSSFIFS
ncbi:uncharacterized protein LOC107429257 isoform X2 [Ziziphus jujuba]|uniref:Uncharacterized protein LOC107429257 isoform X2 n=1 Tax=Ziziphus jujuba TaxID=326968 RepID=A0A6P6GJZ3_ZIZJJ|nr:uncharacterized protein LOC107429257 isoform X2 [Ziziphus jujuba]